MTEGFGWERTLKLMQFHPPAPGRDTFHETRLLKKQLRLNPENTCA